MADGVNYFFLDYLKKNFGEDFPIFVEEIKFGGYSRTQITDMLDDLCRCEKLSKYYDEDVYYIPMDTLLGKSVLSIRHVIERKYIRNDTDVYGFYGGVAMDNYMGLSTQVAATPTIYTNKETSDKRIVQVGRRDVILKRGRTNITVDNADTLTFLEVLTRAPGWWFKDKDEETEEKMEYLKNPSDHRICALYGLRRTGKTIMMKQAMLELGLENCRLIEIPLNVKNIDMLDIYTLLEDYHEQGIRYVFLDEITDLEDFTHASNLLADKDVGSMRITAAGKDSYCFSIARICL